MIILLKSVVPDHKIQSTRNRAFASRWVVDFVTSSFTEQCTLLRLHTPSYVTKAMYLQQR